MNLTRILYTIAITLFFYQVILQSIINTGFANNAILYLFSFIALISAGLLITHIKQDFYIEYLKKHYKSPIRFILLIIGITALIYFWQKEQIGTYPFALLCYFLTSFIYAIESRIAALFAMILLGYTAVLLMLGNEELAEQLTIYVYYFLVITVILQIREYRLNPDCDSRASDYPEPNQDETTHQ